MLDPSACDMFEQGNYRRRRTRRQRHSKMLLAAGQLQVNFAARRIRYTLNLYPNYMRTPIGLLFISGSYWHVCSTRATASVRP